MITIYYSDSYYDMFDSNNDEFSKVYHIPSKCFQDEEYIYDNEIAFLKNAEDYRIILEIH